MHNLRLRYAITSFLAIVGFGLAWFVPGQAQGEIDEEKLKQGAQLFAENCAVCHGPDGKGRIGATLAKDWPSIRPDLRIEETIRNGISGSVMPAWSQPKGGPFDDEQISSLVYYILSWETGAPRLIYPTPSPVPRPAIPPQPEIEGDPNQGAALYDQNCQVCHGPDGKGRIGATLAKAWSSIRPDLRIQSTIQHGVEGTLMPAWSQENGGPLNQVEINNLVAFILSWNVSEAPTPDFAATQISPGSAPLSGQTSTVLVIVAAALLAAGIYRLVRRRNP